jgi:hypothetical protein
VPVPEKSPQPTFIPPDRLERNLAAGLALAAIVLQLWLMGPSTAFLCLGLAASFGAWLSFPWRMEPRRVLPAYLAGLAFYSVHVWEEFRGGFHRVFPDLFGDSWSDAQFLVFNGAWLAVLGAAIWGIQRRQRVAWLAVFVFAITAGVINGIGHLALSARLGRYFPGAYTGALLLAVAVLLLWQVFKEKRTAR